MGSLTTFISHTLLESGSLEIRGQRGQVLVKDSSWFQTVAFFLYPHRVERKIISLEPLLTRTLIPIMGAPSSWPNQLPGQPPPNTITVGFGFNPWTLRDANIWSPALGGGRAPQAQGTAGWEALRGDCAWLVRGTALSAEQAAEERAFGNEVGERPGSSPCKAWGAFLNRGKMC